MVAMLFVGCDGQVAAPPLTLEQQAEQKRVLEEMQKVENPGPFAQTNAKALIYKAFDDLPTTKKTRSDSKRIGVDVLFQSTEGPIKDLDLEQIHVVNADTQLMQPSRPVVQRLTLDGKPADDNDPLFAGQLDFRCLLIFDVPKTWESIKLDYWGDPLTTESVPLEKGAPQLPQRDVQIEAMMQLEEDQLAFDTFLLLIECQNWSRCEMPQDFELRCVANGHRGEGVLNSVVEVDAQNLPLSTPLDDRPLYVPTRRFVGRFRCPEGTTVLDMKTDIGPRSPPQPEPFELPQATMTMLDDRAVRPPQP